MSQHVRQYCRTPPADSVHRWSISSVQWTSRRHSLNITDRVCLQTSFSLNVTRKSKPRRVSASAPYLNRKLSPRFASSQILLYLDRSVREKRLYLHYYHTLNAMSQYQSVHLAARPKSEIVPGETFEVRSNAAPKESDLKDGQVIFRSLYLSLDPAMRGWLNGK